MVGGSEARKRFCTHNRPQISGPFNEFHFLPEERVSDVGGSVGRPGLASPPPPPPGGVNDLLSTYAMYIRMSQMCIAEMFGSVDSNGTEHLRCENAIALLQTRSLLLNVFAAPGGGGGCKQ